VTPCRTRRGWEETRTSASPIEAALSDVKQLLPGVIRAAVVLLPEGLQLGAFGESHAMDYEPLVRACSRCFGGEAGALDVGQGEPLCFTEYCALMDDSLVLMQRGRRNSRIALAVVCALEVNLSLLLTSTRAAIELIEAAVECAELDLD
jgi:hypothetical protein